MIICNMIDKMTNIYPILIVIVASRLVSVSYTTMVTTYFLVFRSISVAYTIIVAT